MSKPKLTIGRTAAGEIMMEWRHQGSARAITIWIRGEAITWEYVAIGKRTKTERDGGPIETLDIATMLDRIAPRRR